MQTTTTNTPTEGNSKPIRSKIDVTYFKNSGKFYADGEWYSEEIDYYKAVEAFKDKVLFNPNATMPGLIGKEWNGPILLDSDSIGYPVLLNLVEHHWSEDV